MLSSCIFNIISGFIALFQPGGISQEKLLTQEPWEPDCSAIHLPLKSSAAQLRETPERSMEMPAAL